MSKRTREVWHCDVCGWEWLPDTNKVPERCPNRECRKRNWNRVTGRPNEASYADAPTSTNWDQVWSKIKPSKTPNKS